MDRREDGGGGSVRREREGAGVGGRGGNYACEEKTQSKWRMQPEAALKALRVAKDQEIMLLGSRGKQVIRRE